MKELKWNAIVAGFFDAAYQSHHEGIEILSASALQYLLPTINRTMKELKSRAFPAAVLRPITINRTMKELKWPAVIETTRPFCYQSHHEGIEIQRILLPSD